MTAPAYLAAKSLARTLTVRLVLTTLTVLVLQAALVSLREFVAETDFHNSYIRREANRLARMVDIDAEPDGNIEDRRPGHYIGPHASAYAFRIVDADGRVFDAHNVALLDAISAWTSTPSHRQDFWIRKFNTNVRMHIAGGLKVRRGTADLWVELATSGDPAGTYLSTVASDIFDDLTMPFLPLMVLGVLVTLLTVRRAFRPLIAAANRADAIAVKELGDRFDVTTLPAEASQFASAINRLLDRVADLISAQRLFIARAAHELRTPLSIMMLELGHLKDPSSKRLEADVKAMSQIVDQLLVLAKLETAPKTGMTSVDVSTVVRELVVRMLGWAEKDGHTLSFHSGREAPIHADETSLREAVRNLIENAVKHTPPGTKIRVEVLSDASIVVEDAGPGLGTLTPDEMQLPFRKGSTTSDGAGLGLAIVRQAAELHGGQLEIGSSQLGGARFAFLFPKESMASI